MTRSGERRRRGRRTRRDITKHACQRISERYGVNGAHSTVPEALAASIRNGRSYHIGWQRRASVHAIAGPAGLAIVLYANKKVVTAVPLDDPYLAALEAYFLAQRPHHEREHRMRALALQLRAELPALARPWHSFEPRYEHPDPQKRPTPISTPANPHADLQEEEHVAA